MNPSNTRCKDAHGAFSRYARPLVDEAIQRAEHLDPEAADLHKLCVALRRLRTLLWAWRGLLGREFVGLERAYLKRAVAAAGEARDWDIAIALLDADWAKLDGQRAEAARREARQRATLTLAGADLKHTLPETFHKVNRELNTAPRRASVKRLASERVRAARRSLRKRMRRARDAIPCNP